MTSGEGTGQGSGDNEGTGTGMPPNIREISENQVAYIQASFPDAAVYPPRGPGDPSPAPVEFIYRGRHLLTRDHHLRNVTDLLNSRRSGGGDTGRYPRIAGIRHPVPGIAHVELAFESQDPVRQAQNHFSLLDEIEQELGPGNVTPDHMVHITASPFPATECPATEPDWVPGDAAPEPAVSRSRCDGRGTLVAVVDTGLVEEAPAMHPWLYGVVGERDLQVMGSTIDRYGGHGTFIASIVRAMAPRAEVRVARVFEKAGAIYESDIVASLRSVLDWAPDVISLSAGTHTWKRGGLLSFRVFVDGPLRESEGTVLVAAAGNDGQDRRFSPAEMDGVIGVGALGPHGDERAWFSDYGDWVKVYAPGQDLVHAFARGLYKYHELRAGHEAEFSGMARWSGTSFSTPVVAGLIAARMSGAGERAPEAAGALLGFARAHALPGVGPVLLPGQACA